LRNKRFSAARPERALEETTQESDEIQTDIVKGQEGRLALSLTARSALGRDTAQTRQLLALSLQQCPCKSPQRLIFVEERGERGGFQIALQRLNFSLVTARRILEELSRKIALTTFMIARGLLILASTLLVTAYEERQRAQTRSGVAGLTE